LDPNGTWRDYAGRSPQSQERFTLWRQQAHRLADLLVDAVANDQIAVAQQLRLSARRGSVHKDTVAALVHKPVGADWSAQEILRIVRPEVYASMRDLAASDPKAKGALGFDVERSLTLADGTKLLTQDLVEVFHKDAASMKVSDGSVEIGDTHHSRVYAWRGPKGDFQYGILRVFTAELPWLQKQAHNRDLFTMSIDDRSMSYRDLQATVREKIESGAAQCIGWLVQNDEIVLDAHELQSGNNQFANFLKSYPETRWKLDSFPENYRFRIRPLYLSREAADHLDQANLKLLEKGAIVGVNVLLKRTSQILRRDALGFERWGTQGGLPYSWNVSDATISALGAE